MPINIKLLKRLGIITGDKTQDEARLHALKKAMRAKSPPDATDEQLDKQINATLLDMVKMALNARAVAEKFVADQGLTLETDADGKPKVEYVWNEQFLCLDVKLKIAGEVPPPNKTAGKEYPFGYEGRDIKIRVNHIFSNSDFGFQQIEDILDEKILATIKFLYKNVEPSAEDILAIRNNLLNTVFTTQELAEYRASPQNVIAKLRELQKKIADITVQLAISMYQQAGTQQPHAKARMFAVKQIEEIEIQLLSIKRKPIVISTFPLTTGDPKRKEHVIDMNIPQSDVTSYDRKFNILRIANAWRVKHYKVNLSDAKPKIILQKTFYRSASIAPITDPPDDEKEFKKQQQKMKDKTYAALENSIRLQAREKIIASLNTGKKFQWEKIQQEKHLEIKSAYVSLVTPTPMLTNTYRSFRRMKNIFKTTEVPEQLVPTDDKVNKTGTFLTNILYTKGVKTNEQDQMINSRRAMERAGNAEIKLSPEDVGYILAHVNNQPPDLEENLKSLKISHSYFDFNFIVNSYAIFRSFSYNEKFNKKGIKRLNAMIDTYLGGKYPELQKLFAKDYKGSWAQQRADIIKQMKNQETGDMLGDKKTVKILRQYIKIRDYFSLANSPRRLARDFWYFVTRNPKRNSRVVDSYKVITKVAKLCKYLDCQEYLFCQSGKDRTGAGANLLLAENGQAEYCYQNNCNAANFSAAKMLNAENHAGALTLQISPWIFDRFVWFNGKKQIKDDPRAFKKLVKRGRFREVGKTVVVQDPESAVNKYKSSTIEPNKYKDYVFKVILGEIMASGAERAVKIKQAPEKKPTNSFFSTFNPKKGEITSAKAALRPTNKTPNTPVPPSSSP